MPKVAKNYKKYWKDYLVECLKMSAEQEKLKLDIREDDKHD